jgi:peptide/nickel transport system substrate-binding protein
MNLVQFFSVFLLAALSAVPTFAKDTFVFGIDGDPGSAINTITTSDRYGLSSVKLLFSPLFVYNGPDAKVFFLAESVTPSKDFKTYTAKLRKGVKWHDGKPFTADDVVFTYEQQLKESNGGWAYGQLLYDGKPVVVKKVDDFTVTFTFPVLTAAAEEAIANIYILPKHLYEGEKDIGTSPKNATPIGTGPYKFKAYKAGESLAFEANPDYFRGAPKIKNYVFRVLSDPNAALLALQNGELDALGGVSPADALKLAANKNLTTLPYDEGRIGYLGFNLTRPLAQNKAVRQAVAYAINRDELIKAAYLSGDYAKAAFSYLPKKAPFFTDSVEKYAFNVAKAKETLAKAGLTNVKLVLAYTAGNKINSTLSLVLQQQLKAAGIEVEITAVNGTALFKQLGEGKGDFDAFLGGYIMGIDPSTFATLYTTGSSSNYLHVASKELDDLFAAGSVETNQAKRKVIYEKTQQWLADDASQISLIENKRILVTTSALGGVAEASLVPVYTFEDSSKLFYK